MYFSSTAPSTGSVPFLSSLFAKEETMRKGVGVDRGITHFHFMLMIIYSKVVFDNGPETLVPKGTYREEYSCHK